MTMPSRWHRYSRLLAGEMVLPYDRILFRNPQAGPRQAINFLLGRVEARLQVRRPWSYPLGLQLEPTTQCQLDCPFCARVKATAGMSEGHMDWGNYERLMREIGPYLTALAFWQWGEPLLHPRLVDMVELAKRYGIITFISTNAQTDPSAIDLRGLMKSGLDLLIISMDGASQPVYEQFRAGGSLERLKTFLAAAVRCRAELPGPGPLLNVRVVATRDNEQEVGAVRDFAAGAGADLFSVKSVSLYYDENADHPALPEQLELRSFQYQGAAQQASYRQLANYCRKPWAWPTLRYDGTLLFCECDHQMIAPLGNVFAAGSFREVWRSTAAQELRSHYRGDGTVDFEFCRRCRYKLDDAIRRVENLRGRHEKIDLV